MEPSDVFLTTAELAIAVVGFSGVVAAFRAKGEARGDELYRVRLTALLGVASTALVASLLPLYFLAGAEPVSWPALAGTQALLLWFYVGYFGWQWLQVRAGSRLFGLFGMLGTIALASFQTHGWLHGGDFQLYLSGLLWQLAIAAIVFVRMAIVMLVRNLENGD